MTNYQEYIEKKEAALAAEQFENDCAEGWQKILRDFPLEDHMANYSLVKEYCAPEPVSLTKFRLSLGNSEFTRQLCWNVKDEAERNIEEIIHLLRTKGRYTDWDLKVEAAKLRLKTRHQVRERLLEVQQKQLAASKPVSQLHAEVKAATKIERRLDGYPTLGQFMVLPSEVRARRVDGEFLRTLAKVDYEHYRKLVRLYGAAQITERMNEN
jgi:hypothetical protein